MVLYHIVLAKSKYASDSKEVALFKDFAYKMVGKIPGLQSVDVGPGIVATAQRAQGYTYGLFAILDDEKALEGYGPHEAHILTRDAVLALIDNPATDILAFDFNPVPK